MLYEYCNDILAIEYHEKLIKIYLNYYSGIYKNIHQNLCYFVFVLCLKKKVNFIFVLYFKFNEKNEKIEQYYCN